MTAGQGFTLIGLPVLVLALVATTLIVWLRHRFRRARAQLAALLADDPALRGPESAIYRGSTGGYSQVLGNGQLALTAHRLLFQKGLGSLVEVHLADVTGVRTAKTFNRGVVGGRTHLIVVTHKGEVGYFVTDLDAWVAAIEAAGPAGRGPGVR